MSEHMAADIWIGGKIQASLVTGLCEAICREQVGMEWGCYNFKPTSAEELLDAREDNGDGVKLLHFCDDQARWGEFEGLEAFLREHCIAFRRQSDGRYEYSAEVAEYRPEEDLVVFVTDPQHEPYVLASELTDVEKKLAKAVKHLEDGNADKALRAAQAAQRLLRRQLPPTLPPLEPFTIEEDQQA
jgi:hypothetical protein